MPTGTGWKNVEYRSYHFTEDQDDDASVEETNESRRRRRGKKKPLTETERYQLNEVTKMSLQSGESHPLQTKA